MCWKNIENKEQVNQKYSFKGLIVLLTMISMSVQAQQLPQFSQYIFNGLHINPAYAGYNFLVSRVENIIVDMEQAGLETLTFLIKLIILFHYTLQQKIKSIMKRGLFV